MVVEILMVAGVLGALGALELASRARKGGSSNLARQRSLGRLVMEACEASGVEGFSWYDDDGALSFDDTFVHFSAPRVRGAPDLLSSFELVFNLPYTKVFVKEPSNRPARRRLLRGFGVAGQFGIGGKDHEILEWLTEEVALALVDALEGGWSTIHSSLGDQDTRNTLSLKWSTRDGFTPARLSEELELLLPLAARLVHAWSVEESRSARLAKLARSRTASSEVNWRAAQRLLTAHASSDEARALTSALDELSEEAQMACATWGECEGLSDDALSMLLRDVVLKGPEPMVDALVDRLAEEGVGEVHVKALKALAAKGFDLSALKRRVGAIDGLLGGQLSVADQGPRGAISEAGSSNLRGAITGKDGDEP